MVGGVFPSDSTSASHEPGVMVWVEIPNPVTHVSGVGGPGWKLNPLSM